MGMGMEIAILLQPPLAALFAVFPAPGIIMGENLYRKNAS
jgi:hypothetical protein